MIENIPKINFTIRRGDNWTSPKYTFFNEKIPPGISIDDLEKGIADGVYTYKDWRDYQVDAAVIFNKSELFALTDYMVVSSEGRYIHFTMTADETKLIAEKFFDLPGAGDYDLQACNLTTREVYTLWGGTFTAIPDLTEREVCGAP